MGGPWYYIAEPSEFLVVTGIGIADVRIVKKALILPWQRVNRISISPFDFSLDLQAMSAEKISARIPAVFTIGPEPDNGDALKKYALLLSGNPDSGRPIKGTIQPTSRSHVQDIVKGIIEGETRVIVSGMTMEEIFRERQVFKQKVIDNVQSELNQFGLRIYNANVKELQDTPGSEYFAFLSRKAHEGASNQARIDVAEARMRGEIGEAEKTGHTKQEISKINAETAVLETKRKAEKAAADAALSTRQTELDMGIKLAQIKATREAEARDAELQKLVEMKKAEMQLERLRASDVTKSKIAREASEQQADAEYYSRVKDVEGQVFKDRAKAEARLFSQNKDAEASYLAKVKDADAAFYAKKKEAEATVELAKAYGALSGVLGGPQGLMQYLMMQNNTYEKLALANAKAIQGLQPKISHWSNGDGGNTNASPLKNLMQSLPPLLSTIHEQTGISPPDWIARMPSPPLQDKAEQVAIMEEKGGLTNGVHT